MFLNKWIGLVLVVAILLGGVWYGSNSRNPADCPANANAAAKLFGGRAAGWTQVEGGWLAGPNTNRLSVTVPSWYARVGTNAEGGQTFQGAVVDQIKFTLQAGETLTLVCPIR